MIRTCRNSSVDFAYFLRNLRFFLRRCPGVSRFRFFVSVLPGTRITLYYIYCASFSVLLKFAPSPGWGELKRKNKQNTNTKQEKKK